MALALAQAGVSVLIGDINEAAAADTADAVRNLGRSGASAVCDIGSDASVAAFADRALETFGRIDLIFNHAGMSVGGALEHVTSDDWNCAACRDGGERAD